MTDKLLITWPTSRSPISSLQLMKQVQTLGRRDRNPVSNGYRKHTMSLGMTSWLARVVEELNMAPRFVQEGCGAIPEERFVITSSTTSSTYSVTSASCFYPLQAGRKFNRDPDVGEISEMSHQPKNTVVLYQMSTWLYKLIWSPKEKNEVRNEVEKGISVKQRGDKPSFCLLNLNFQSKPCFQFPEENGIEILHKFT